MKMCLVFMLICIFSLNSLADPIYWHHDCSNETGNVDFITNRNKLVSSLSKSPGHDGFNRTSVGQDPNMAYALFLCRGDLVPENCHNCANVVSTDIVRRCPNNTWAVIWYDKCMLRYSNQDLSFIRGETPSFKRWYDVDVVDTGRFNQFSESLPVDIANQSSNHPLGSKKFATKEANYTPSHTLYSLAQCRPDISGDDCSYCLRIAISDLCCKSKPAFGFYLSCTVQYNITPFYQKSIIIAEPPAPGKRGTSSQTVIKVVVPIIIGFCVFSSLFYGVLRWKKRKKKIARKKRIDGNKSVSMNTRSNLQFDLSMIEITTNKFAEANKIGSGGFGSVYKGILPNGQEIAVKRLSSNSGQGAQEFENEVLLVAKLQHRNLVKLLGYCLERKERMLIYEFVPNKSLDHFIFDPKKQRQFDWPKRYKIIRGITRGLLYLHSESRLKIIHRDLKAGNILLDEDMTPKISDFGLAKIFGENESQECTKRIVGTFGYMPPEYAVHGQFSEKSDVFSFGVLMLEIVSGKRNTSFCHSEYADNLLTYAWRHWKNGTSMELMDSTLQDSYVINEVLRCIHISLLCIQEDPDARPTMTKVDLMLSSSSVSLPPPQRTAFFFGSVTATPKPSIVEQDFDSTTTITSSSTTKNEASISMLCPR